MKNKFDWDDFLTYLGLLAPAFFFLMFMLLFVFWIAPELVRWRYSLP